MNHFQGMTISQAWAEINFGLVSNLVAFLHSCGGPCKSGRMQAPPKPIWQILICFVNKNIARMGPTFKGAIKGYKGL